MKKFYINIYSSQGISKPFISASHKVFNDKESADYEMKNIDTGESERFTLEEGDIVFRTGRIVHGGDFQKGSIVIDGAVESYVSRDFNDIIDG